MTGKQDKNPFDAAELTRTLRREIPLSGAMGLVVSACDSRGLSLHAPLSPNLNHTSTAFGGSLYSAAALACWGMLHATLAGQGLHARILIRNGEMAYTRPVDGDFSVHCQGPDPDALAHAAAALVRRGKARVPMSADVRCGDEDAARFTGTFVLLLADGR